MAKETKAPKKPEIKKPEVPKQEVKKPEIPKSEVKSPEKLHTQVKEHLQSGGSADCKCSLTCVCNFSGDLTSDFGISGFLTSCLGTSGFLISGFLGALVSFAILAK
jgi:hypothetical protein